VIWFKTREIFDLWIKNNKNSNCNEKIMTLQIRKKQPGKSIAKQKITEFNSNKNKQISNIYDSRK
jgi:hypothetical protein